MMKTILQKIRVDLAILEKKKDNLSPMLPRWDAQISKVLRCVKQLQIAFLFLFFRKRRAIRLLCTVVRTVYSSYHATYSIFQKDVHHHDVKESRIQSKSAFCLK